MIEYVKNLWTDSGIRDMRAIPRQEVVYVMMGDHRDMKGIDARGSRQNRFSQNLFGDFQDCRVGNVGKRGDAAAGNHKLRRAVTALAIGCKHPVIPVPVLARRRHEIGEPVEELKRRELDDAVRPRPRGRSRAARTDPVGGLVSGEHVADFGCAAACVTCHRESLERKGWPGPIPQQVLQALKIARHVAVDERDPNTGID